MPDSTKQTDRDARFVFAGPVIVSLLALVAVTLTLDPADCRPGLPAGPGVTLDETFNVQMGAFLVDIAPREYGWAILNPFNLLDAFEALYNPDHPPLGRLWLGVSHRLVQTVAPPDGLEDAPFVTVSARFGSAVAFALTVLLIGVFTGRRYGNVAGTAAAMSLVLMPRVFGHAHLAALETVTNLVWTMTILGTASLWTHGARPRDRAGIVTGLLIGAVLLTKMQAILLPPLISVWALWHWRRQALRPLAIAMTVGLVVFISGWPSLWSDFPGSLVEYFSRTTERATLHVWYFGEKLTDRDMPWHYAAVMFATTVPGMILLTGLSGTFAVSCWSSANPSTRSRDATDSDDSRPVTRLFQDPVATLILGSVIAPVVLFSLPFVAVYDGVRLFLVAFPGFAILAGVGFAYVHQWLVAKSRRAGVVVPFLLMAQSLSLYFYHPHWLSYYGLQVGGLRGATAIGLETTYWSDTFSRSFLQEVTNVVPENSRLEITPVMHPSQWIELLRQSPILQRHGIHVQAYSDPSVPSADYLAVFHRLADMPPQEQLAEEGWAVVAEFRTRGVTVASIWKRGLANAPADDRPPRN